MGLRQSFGRWFGGAPSAMDYAADGSGASGRGDDADWAARVRAAVNGAAAHGAAPAPNGTSPHAPAPNGTSSVTTAGAGNSRPAPSERPPAVAAGRLVVGDADWQQAVPPMPDFYLPPPKRETPDTQLTARDRELVREAFAAVAGKADQLVRLFYAELFVALPDEAMQMFPSGMSDQREAFGRAVVQWVVAEDADALTAHLEMLGADHRKFAVEPRHYDIAGRALINAWSHLAGSAWTQEYERAVVASYTRLASIMITGAEKHADEPATWGATVVEHHRLHRDFAVLRVQPDAPYAFKPGQYLTVETSTRRRLWRQMSFASAPRADNTFDLQVRAANSTGVSGALVMHTRVGDRLRLGPPRGTELVVEPATVTHGLLCISAGTGSAPISAVVESVLQWPRRPPLYVFIGGRRAEDLAAVDRLQALVGDAGATVDDPERGDRAQVFGVLSDDPAYPGYHGRVEDVVPALTDWARLEVDVLVAGPDRVIGATVDALTARGVPRTRVHFDQYDIGDQTE